MPMDGYRYWVERHRLLVRLAEDKQELAGRSDADRAAAEVQLDRTFREQLDALYGEARGEFESARPKN